MILASDALNLTTARSHCTGSWKVLSKHAVLCRQYTGEGTCCHGHVFGGAVRRKAREGDRISRQDMAGFCCQVFSNLATS